MPDETPDLTRNGLVDQFLRHVCQTSENPLGVVVERAQGTKIRDTDGREYLDLLAGIGVANIGHSHPLVVGAIRAQVERHLHVSVYGEMIQRPQVALAARLAELTPGDLSVVYFTNSGAEAVEGALKTARKLTDRSVLIAFEGSFHGDTFGALSVSGNPAYRWPFEPLLPDVHFLPFNETTSLDAIDSSVAAVIVEPIQAEGGVRIADESFLRQMRQRCDATGTLIVADEVLTGFGRTGKLFACEHTGLVPDILVLAKALGAGMPLGAFVSRPGVMRCLSHDPPLAHVTTFGGHPVSCAAGLVGLDVLLTERLPERAATVGREWLDRLRALVGGPLVAVRGIGLLLALEFADAGSTRQFATRCFAERLILNWTLHRDTVIRLAPPLTITPEEVDHATGIFEKVLRELT
jgi:acetylornithine/succinyldiaminopimelate/putrescine aminotransferase